MKKRKNRGASPYNQVDKPDNKPILLKSKLKPRSINQSKYINEVNNNDITFCSGVPGSGKTHIAIGMALEYLISGMVNKIIITRPVVEAGEKLGYLPGTVEDKLHPYLLPLFDEVGYFIDSSEWKKLNSNKQIDIVPLGLMRGRTFNNSFIVADECQNASYDQLKMLLTRIGFGSKMVLTGDINQSDLDVRIQGGFAYMTNTLMAIDGVGYASLEAIDIMRNPIISKIIGILDDQQTDS